jgi:quinol monooxygenase YgiN
MLRQGDIYYVCKYTIKDHEKLVQGLVQDMTRDTKKYEPGTLAYEWHISSDQKQCHVLQLYESSDALLKHIQGVFFKYKERVAECLEFQSLEIYGAASEKVKVEAADAFTDIWQEAKTTYFERLGGYNRAGRTQLEVQRIL